MQILFLLEMSIIDYTGVIGVFLILLAYFLLISGRFSKDNIFYLGMNAMGAALACTASVLLQYWPFIILEGVWTLVSLIAIFKSIIKIQAAN